MKAKTVKEVLVATKWILSHYEWLQDSYSSNDANGKPFGFCLVGAMQRVETDDPYVFPKAYRFLAKEVIGEIAVSPWNDRFGRTKDEVLKMLDQAIERAP